MLKTINIMFLIALVGSFMQIEVFAAGSTRWGAKVVKETFGATPLPEVILPAGWKLCSTEALTGVNDREYYFTIENENDNSPAPVIQIVWPGIKIANVYGGTGVRSIENGVEFRPISSKAPTSFTTILPLEGSVSMGVFHNVPGMQAGYYRDKPYPEAPIQAHLNFLFAAREMMRAFGFTNSPDALDGVINLYGFETNYPNGHVDAPPHFHIMTMWDKWKNVQATHFILDSQGKVLRNDHFVVENNVRNKEKSISAAPGTAVEMTDRSGDIRFCLEVLPDGSGIELRVPGSNKRGRIQSGNAPQSVTYAEQLDRATPWVYVAEIRVQDDSQKGILTVTKQTGQKKSVETWNYDPNTGRLIK